MNTSSSGSPSSSEDASDPIDFAKLEEVARAATQGEWVHFDRETVSNIYSAGNDGSLLAEAHSYNVNVGPKRPTRETRKANALHIATFDPPTVLRLIELAKGVREQ